jgi:hypothetical protein
MPRINIHKTIPTYITTECYQRKYVKTAIKLRRLLKDNKPPSNDMSNLPNGTNITKRPITPAALGLRPIKKYQLPQGRYNTQTVSSYALEK